jgi:hypothetical protein
MKPRVSVPGCTTPSKTCRLQMKNQTKNTFQLYQKHQGRPIRVCLGTFPDTGVEKARKEALKAKGALGELAQTTRAF